MGITMSAPGFSTGVGVANAAAASAMSEKIVREARIMLINGREGVDKSRHIYASLMTVGSPWSYRISSTVSISERRSVPVLHE
jgi:hypothetical protein